MDKNRGSFTGKIGFVLAAAGSAVGLGNIWRFPYLAAKYGGGIFLLVYIILAVTFGFALMIGEIALGRKTGQSAIGAFAKLNKKYAFIGYLASVVPMIILPYYSVIGGWVTKYMVMFTFGSGTAAADGKFFGNFTGEAVEPIIWFLIYIALTSLVVLFGVEKGIEKVSKFLMPVLVLLSLFIAVYVCFMDGAWEGIVYYLKPDFQKFSATTVLAAMGQLFYSMSLAMGIMITYGSYMKKDVSLESSVTQIELFDTGIAFLAGLMMIPAVFATMSPDALSAGPSFMFKTLPVVFDRMYGGQVIGAVFFAMVFLAALTSSISLMETVVSIFCDKLKIGRKLCCLCVFVGTTLLGLVSCFGFSILKNVKPLNMDLLTFFDFLSNSVIMPVVALLTCIFIGYVIKPKAIVDEVESSGKFTRRGLFVVMVKYIAPVFIVLILVSSVLDAFGIFKI